MSIRSFERMIHEAAAIEVARSYDTADPERMTACALACLKAAAIAISARSSLGKESFSLVCEHFADALKAEVDVIADRVSRLKGGVHD